MIHQTALIDCQAELESGVEVGPYCIVGPQVKIGKNTKIGPHVIIDKWTEIGGGCNIFQFTSIGQHPRTSSIKGKNRGLVWAIIIP